MLSPPDVETSTSLVLSGSGVPSPDAGVCTPAAAAAGEAPSPARDGCSWRSSTCILDYLRLYLACLFWLFVYVFLGLDTFLGYAHYFDVICIILVCFSCLFVTLFLVLQMLI